MALLLDARTFLKQPHFEYHHELEILAVVLNIKKNKIFERIINFFHFFFMSGRRLNHFILNFSKFIQCCFNKIKLNFFAKVNCMPYFVCV